MYELYDMLDEYLLFLQAENKAKTTLKTRKKHLTALFIWLEQRRGSVKVDLTSVTTAELRAYTVYHKDKGNSASYVNNIIKSVRSLFAFMVEDGYMQQDANPVTRVKLMRQTKKLTPTFDDTEIIGMLNVHKGSNSFLAVRNTFIIMLLADTGLRIHELAKLQDSDFQTRSITITGKGDKQRMLFISPLVAKQYAKYCRIKKQYFKRTGRAPVERVFTNFYGDPLTPEGANVMLKRTAERSGLNIGVRVSCHTFRHYFAQKFLMSGGDIYTLSALLGHSNLETTRVYLASIPQTMMLEKGVNSSPMSHLGKGLSKT